MRREEKGWIVIFTLACVGCGWIAGWAQCRYGWVGKVRLGNKNITFLVETIPKLRFLRSFHLFGHHAILRVGPVWGVRWARIRWKKFSIVLDYPT
jgi:hypothetical protein